MAGECQIDSGGISMKKAYLNINVNVKDDFMDKITQLCGYIERNNSHNSFGIGNHIYGV